MLLKLRIGYDENIRIQDFLANFKIGETILLLSDPQIINPATGAYHMMFQMKIDFLSKHFKVSILNAAEWEQWDEDKKMEYFWSNKIFSN